MSDGTAATTLAVRMVAITNNCLTCYANALASPAGSHRIDAMLRSIGPIIIHGVIMSLRHMLCAAALVACAAPAMAANDGVPSTEPGAPNTTYGASPAPAQGGVASSPGAPTCRQAKAKQPISAEEKARRKAIRAQQAAQGIAPAAKPHRAKLPLC
ncbi:hypothetical protein [Reyranella sp.]|uniref:hypothetical protein n=1 Tax=Reyranella sp. TaxID=1929291 RepID=UPI003C7E1751